MTGLLDRPTLRRGFLGRAGILSGGALLAGCATRPLGGYSLTDAVRTLLLISSERAFARLTAPGGYWDQQVASVGLDTLLGARGNVLAGILTSGLFRSRLQDAFAGFAVEASYRAAPVVTDAIRVIGVQGALDLIRGGPTAATGFLRGAMGDRLLGALVPELGEAMRLADEPLVGRAISALVGVDLSGVANRVGRSVEDAIWTELGREEALIRADPRSTRDPALIAVLAGAGAL